MYEKIKVYVEKHHMLEKKDKVIAGVSGGADSVCLLFVLMRLSKEMDFSIHAVHVNHGIRGQSADKDEDFVCRLCESLGIPFTVFRENIPVYAKEHGLTEEEAGRKVRRDLFEKVLGEHRGTKIALAHHLNDNAETLLFNLCRGTGLKGLGAIAPASGVWIRPLLCVKRIEIESYLEKRGISYCTDETNAQNTYTRNKIRNEVFPYLEKNVNEQAVLHITETAEQMRVLGEYIADEVLRLKKICTKDDGLGGLLLIEESYRKTKEVFRPYLLHELLCDAAGYRKDIEGIHVRLTEELLCKQVGRQVNLPYQVTAVRCYEGIQFIKKREVPVRIPEEEGKFRLEIIDREMISQAFPQKNYTKWFDYDIIKNTVKIRHREPGDYLTIDKYGNTQKLKAYFINEKIPKNERDSVWLAADGSHIMWVVGYRQNQMYQITDKTKRILEIQFYGGEEHGRISRSDA